MDGQQHMKRCSNCSLLEKCKYTVKYHLKPVRMVIIKILQITSAGEDMEKRELSYTIGKNVSWSSHYEK